MDDQGDQQRSWSHPDSGKTVVVEGMNIVRVAGQTPILRNLHISVQPMYDILGTPGEQKRQCLYGTHHHIERKDLIKETLAWLDLYLGPVR